MRPVIELLILGLAVAVIAIVLSSCSGKRFMKNCVARGQTVYECEEI